MEQAQAKIDNTELTSSVSRLAYLDAARGSLMILGVVYHSAAVYATAPWTVHDPAGHTVFDWVVIGLHTFRMPAFFWIAGLFAALGLDRLPRHVYFRHRIQRLFVPLVATFLTFNLLQYLIVSRFPLSHSNHDPNLLSHLWFLVDLIVFTGISVIAFKRGDALTTKLTAICTSLPGVFSLLLVLAIGTAAPTLALGLWVGPNELEVKSLGLITSLDRLAIYFPFFLFGLLTYRSEVIRRRFERIHPALLLPALALNVWLTLDPPTHAPWTLILLAHSFLTWVAVGGVIGLFRRNFGVNTARLRWVADASYPVYLSHMFFVITFGSALVLLPLEPVTKFVFLTLGSLSASFGFAHLVRKIGPLSWLYSGQVKDAIGGFQRAPHLQVGEPAADAVSRRRAALKIEAAGPARAGRPPRPATGRDAPAR